MVTFDSEPFTVSNDEARVFDIASRRVPSDWKPDPTAALDDRLPLPWPEQYVKVFQQPFNPHGFFTNAAALSNEYDRTQSAEVRQTGRDLYGRMREYSVVRDGARYLIYTFPKSYRKIRVDPPWTSAYASGAALIGLVLLADGGIITDADSDAQQILAGMASPVTPSNRRDLWVSFVDDDGCLWFEEMPLPQHDQPRILNGHIRALTGLYIYWVRRSDQLALDLLRAGTLTVKRHAMHFRRPGDVNSYDLLSPPRADYGPKRTVQQQDFLFQMTGDAVFAEYRDLFAADIAQLPSSP